jgi:CheY-like chemotaxis protein/HPt (histidine-containing phosphotransfer) domain-containing protein
MKSISFLESKGVDIPKSLELFGDEATYNDSIGEFLVGIHKKINDLIKFMEAKDLQNYAITVHSMKSDARYFGFNKLADLAYEHELKSKEGDLYYVTTHINDLIGETNNSIVLLQEYMKDDDSSVVGGEAAAPAGEVYDKKTILVVDDSNIIRNFVKRIFSDRYNVGTATDGEEAINIIKANMDNDFIETILLDLNMPKVDGFAVLDFMKENGLLKRMPVSIISGDSSKETIDRAFTYQIVDMLSKPFNDQSVKMVIEKTLIYKEMQ